MAEARDIIVKVPASEREHVLTDKCNQTRGHEAWWTVRRAPKSVIGGWKSNILLQCEGEIIAVAPVDRVELNSDGTADVFWETHLAKIQTPTIHGRAGAWRGYTYVNPEKYPSDADLVRAW